VTDARVAESDPRDPRYLATVDRLLRSQAYRERGAAAMFEAALNLAPDATARRRLAGHVTEEREHYARVCGVWSSTFDAPSAALERWVDERLREQPLPAVGSWLELAMAQFLFDRAGFWQLGEYVGSSFTPYAALAREIVADEREHQDAGARVVVALCGAPDTDGAAAQAAFARWLRVALLSFGRPGGAGNHYAIAARLKPRDSGDVLRDFVRDIQPTVAAAGLSFPAPESLALALPEGLAWPP
jgi:1,2-phenylacetyl-CoA epoxidase catalytic subunit